MTLLKRKRVLAAQIETTPGTAETLTAPDAAFNVYDPIIQPEIEVTPREGQGSFGHLAGVAGARKGKCTFKTDWSWDGTATEPSWADTFFPACGVVKATNTFTPRSEAPGTNVKTLTLGIFQDGIFRSLRGCVGTFKIILEAGKAVMVEWGFTGIWDTPTDVAIIAPTYPTDPTLRWADAVTTWNSVALNCQSCTLDIGNTIMLREGTASGNAAGYIAGVITDRRPTLVVNPESKLVATQDRYGLFLSQTQYAFTTDIGGASAPKVVISAPKCSIDAITEGEREKLVTDEITMLCGQNGSTADQEFSIVFTP